MMFLHQVGVALPSGRSHVVVAVWWDRNAPSLDKRCHQKRLRTADSAVGELLSLALLPVLGIRIVLLCNQLRWL